MYLFDSDTLSHLWCQTRARHRAELPVTPFDEAAGRQLRQLQQDKALKKIGRADLLIACIALANDATLVTRNRKNFRQVLNLKVEKWVD